MRKNRQIHAASKKLRRLRSVQQIAATIAIISGVNATRAAIDTWVGNNSPNWSGDNWTGGNNPPVDFDSLVFSAPGAAGTLLTNDLTPNLNIAGITFDAGATSGYAINGNAITLGGPILNTSTVLQTVNLPLALNALQTVTTTAGGGDISLGGIITGAGGVRKTVAVTTAPTGTLFLTNTASTYTGETIIGLGTVNVASIADYGVASSVGARALGNENTTVTGVSLHFQGGTLQYTGSTPQSTNRNIRVLNGATGGTIDASGTTPDATLSFTHTGANINLFDTAGVRTITLTGTNTGRNSFSIQLTNQGVNQTSLRKSGTGTWYLPNTDNTFTGETIFAGGILNLASLSDYGVGSTIGPRAFTEENTTVTGVSLHFQGGTLQYTGSTPQSTNRNIRILNGNGGTIDASGSTPSATLSFTHTGANINLFDTGGVRALTLTGTNTGNNTFSIQLTNQSTNATGLIKNGPGTWILNGPDSNTGTGTTTVNGGTLILGKINAVSVTGGLIIGDGTDNDVAVLGGTGGNQISDGSVVTFNGQAGATGILRMKNMNETVAGISSFNGAGIVENAAGVTGTATLTVNIPAGQSQSYSGLLRDGAGTGVDGTLALVINGPGTLTLAGTASHTGATTVSAGTLTVDGSLGAGTSLSVTNATVNGVGTIASPVTVGNGGVLSSNGTVSGVVALNSGGMLAGIGAVTGTVNAASGSRISPGGPNAPGVLTISTLNISAGALLDYEFGAGNDLLIISTPGGLVLNGGAFNLYAAGGIDPLTANGTYDLIDYTGSFLGALSNLSIANSQVGKFYNLTNDAANTLIRLTVADATLTEWNGGAGTGQWTTAGNWTAGVPNAPGAVAKLGLIPTAPTTIAVNGPKTVGGILFDNPNSYTITGTAADTLTLNNGVAAASVAVNSGTHTISAPIVLATSANVSTAAGTTLNIKGNIAGGKPFIVSGSGLTILTGTNTFSTTAINGGTLQIGDGGTIGTLGTGDVSVGAGATLVFQRSDSFTIPNNISGPGGTVTKLGNGTLTLSGANSFGSVTGGGLLLNGGIVKLANANALGAAVSLNFNGGTLDLNGNSVNSSAAIGDVGFVTDTAAGTGVSTLTIDQSINTLLGVSITNGPTRQVGVTKQGTGVLSLSGDNSFTGPLQIFGGTVIALGDGTLTPILSNVTLGNGSSSVMLTAGTAARQFGNSTVLTFNNAGKDAKFQLRGSDQTVAGLDASADSSVTLAIIQNDEAGSPGFTVAPGLATLIINAETDHSFTGLIRNQVGGGLNIRKIGPGTQEIRNALVQLNSFATATVDEGKLVFNYIPNGTVTNSFGAGTNFVVNANGTLAFDGTTIVPAAAGSISGEGLTVKQGTGILTLQNINNFGSKGITLNDGTLQVGSDSALLPTTAPININGGNIRAASATREIANPVIVNNSFTIGRQTNLNFGLALTKDVTITADNPDTTFNTTSAFGPITGNFRVTFQQGVFAMGAGALIVNGINTNGGGTTIKSGRVNVSVTGQLANADLVVNGGELNLNNVAQTVTGLSGTGGTMNLAAGHTLTVEQQLAGTYSGIINGSGNLVKSGPATLTFGGTTPSFFGSTTVTSGTLLVSGSLSGSLTVTGATSVLGGTGTVGPIITTGGATVNPGAAGPGTLTSTADLTMSADSTLRLDLVSAVPGTGYDQLAVLSSANLGGATLSLGGSYLQGSAGVADLFFVLLNNGFGPINGTFAGLAEGSTVTLSNGQRFALTYLADSGTASFTGGNDVALMAIPEPSCAALLAGGTLLGLGRRRRR